MHKSTNTKNKEAVHKTGILCAIQGMEMFVLLQHMQQFDII